MMGGLHISNCFARGEQKSSSVASLGGWLSHNHAPEYGCAADLPQGKALCVSVRPMHLGAQLPPVGGTLFAVISTTNLLAAFAMLSSRFFGEEVFSWQATPPDYVPRNSIEYLLIHGYQRDIIVPQIHRALAMTKLALRGAWHTRL